MLSEQDLGNVVIEINKKVGFCGSGGCRAPSRRSCRAGSLTAEVARARARTQGWASGRSPRAASTPGSARRRDGGRAGRATSSGTSPSCSSAPFRGLGMADTAHVTTPSCHGGTRTAGRGPSRARDASSSGAAGLRGPPGAGCGGRPGRPGRAGLLVRSGETSRFPSSRNADGAQGDAAGYPGKAVGEEMAEGGCVCAHHCVVRRDGQRPGLAGSAALRPVVSNVDMCQA